MRFPALTSAALLVAAWLPAPMWAGEVSAPRAQDAPIAQTPSNPLSFFNGALVFDFQERIRWENRNNNYDFNSSVHSVTDDNFFLNRFRLGVLLQPTNWLRIYVQGQSSEELNSERPNIPGTQGAEGDDAYDLRQAYVEISNYDRCPWGLKLGRQTLIFGAQRILGENDWSTLGRTYDAARVTYKGEGFQVDAFAGTPAVIYRDRFDESDLFNGDGLDRDMVLSGVYFTTNSVPFGTWDVYGLGMDRSNGTTGNFEGNLYTAPTKGSLSAPSDFATFGTRVEGDPKKLHGFEFQSEFAYQIGWVRALPLNAMAATAGVGYTFDQPWKPRLYVEYNYGSGDDDPNSKHIGTFQNLFASNHRYYGNMDFFAWKNMHNALVSFLVQPVPSLALKLDYNAFWLANTNDAWYRSNDISTIRPVTAAAQKASNYAGQELDFVATWTFGPHLEIQGGYSFFWAGQYLKDTGAHDNADFAYVMTKLTF